MKCNPESKCGCCEIVERLKKQIEETNHPCDCEYGGCRHSFANELQKILGDTK